ncbi:hypothetical protein HY838_02190 [Candidatus Azambacteria bacterium]|nr:hypothetical protein [Candidatus Azambacteria bacterium]
MKVFDNESELQEIMKFRNDDGGYVAIIQGMRNVANLDWRKFFPGKEMCKKIPNFNPIDYLSILDKNNLPKELVKYVMEVKKFYKN